MIRTVLLIEDDDSMRLSLTQTIELGGMSVIQANGFDQARRAIRANFAGVILSDIRMPQKDGFSVLEYVQTVDPDLPVIFLTGEADVPMALRAMKAGAYDFLEKPSSPDHLLEVLGRALEFRDLIRRNRLLEQQISRTDVAALNFPGKSKPSSELRDGLRAAAQSNAHVHLYGAKGAGRRLSGHTIYSLRELEEPFLSIDLRTQDSFDTDTPHALLMIKHVDHATEAQTRLLTSYITQNPQKPIITTGIDRLDTIDRDLFSKLEMGLEVSQINVPDLTARHLDREVIFEHVLRNMARSLNQDLPVLDVKTRTHIRRHSWAGNLPEMRSFARSFFDMDQTSEDLTLQAQLDRFEEVILIDSLRRNNGKAQDSAKELGLARKTFYDRLARHGLRPKDFR